MHRSSLRASHSRPLMPIEPHACSSRSSGSSATIACGGRSVERAALGVRQVVREVGADDDQRLGPAPQPLEQRADLVGRAREPRAGRRFARGQDAAGGTAARPRASARARAPILAMFACGSARSLRTTAASTPTRPSGVSSSVASGSASPRTPTWCAGPSSTMRPVTPCQVAYALAAMGPEYTYPACGTTRAFGACAEACFASASKRSTDAASSDDRAG